MLKTLEELIKLVRERKKSSKESSYTKKLLHDKTLSLEKVKEEIAELIEAVDNNTNTVHEAADVLYHLVVYFCLLYTSPSPRDGLLSRMPSSA